MEGSVVLGRASAPAEAGAEAVAPPPVLGACSSIQTSGESESGSAFGNRAERRALARLYRMMNEDTGEVVEYDPRKSRIGRMRRAIHAWARGVNLLTGGSGYRCVMETLTFAMADGWYPRAISEYMKRLADYLGDNLIAASWVAEIQPGRLKNTGDSVIHYHVELVVRAGTDVPKPDESGMWTHGWSNRKSWCGVYYLCKYASKGISDGEVFPKGARMFAVSKRHWRVLALQSAAEYECALIWHKLARLPAWLSAFLTSREAILSARKVDGGWLVGDCIHKSPWRLVW